jgi:hypothetical protein
MAGSSNLSSDPIMPPPKSAKTADRPQTTSRTTTGPKKTAQPSGKLSFREEAVNGIFQLGAFGLIVAGQPADAGALGKYGPGIAHEAASLAESNDGMAKAIDYITEAGPYAGLLTAAMPLVLQLLANHKVMKAEHLAGAGVVPPEALAAEVKADMARQQIQAQRAQAEAEQELAAMARENAQRQAEAATNGQAAPAQPSMGSQTP